MSGVVGWVDPCTAIGGPVTVCPVRVARRVTCWRGSSRRRRGASPEELIELQQAAQGSVARRVDVLVAGAGAVTGHRPAGCRCASSARDDRGARPPTSGSKDGRTAGLWSVDVSTDSRDRILSLAVDAIDAGGEAAVRVNHICAEAGVSPPVLYYHFGSRDGLVIAAQVARYTRRSFKDIANIGAVVAACTSSDELRTVLVTTWTLSLARRTHNRWVRTSALGSAYARPELEAAIAKAQDEITAELCKVFEPCREKGWFRPDIDLVSTVSWHHSVLIGRVHIERGQKLVDPAEWDRLTLDALVHAFFGA